MKLKALNIFIGLFIAACGITSCLDSDYTEYEYSSNSSITAFSIKYSRSRFRLFVRNQSERRTYL